mgnify:CR=1 FL=1
MKYISVTHMYVVIVYDRAWYWFYQKDKGTVFLKNGIHVFGFYFCRIDGIITDNLKLGSFVHEFTNAYGY